MDLLNLFTTTEGRLARKPFWLGLIAIYIAGFCAQMLLDGAVRARAGLTPFMVAQTVLLWAWLAIHIKRLRDAGQRPAGAIGVAVVYALALCAIAAADRVPDQSERLAGHRGRAIRGRLRIRIDDDADHIRAPVLARLRHLRAILKMLIFIACLPVWCSDRLLDRRRLAPQRGPL